MTLEDRVAALEAAMAAVQVDVVEHSALFALPRERNEVFRVEFEGLGGPVWTWAGASLLTVGDLYGEIDCTDMAVEVQLYISGLASLCLPGATIGTSITVDGVSSEHPPITVPASVDPNATVLEPGDPITYIPAPVSYDPVTLATVLAEGTGVHDVSGQLLVVGGGTIYVNSSPQSKSVLRGLRL